MTRELVGHIGVDAGLVWLGDPCYIKHHPELAVESKWREFCESLRDMKLPQEAYSGILTRTGWGDGEYPVYATKTKDGDIKKIEIVFITDEEENEYYDDPQDPNYDPEDVLTNFQSGL